MARLVHIYYEPRMNNEGLWLRRYPDWPFQRLYAAVDEFQGEYKKWLRTSRYRDLIG